MDAVVEFFDVARCLTRLATARMGTQIHLIVPQCLSVASAMLVRLGQANDRVPVAWAVRQSPLEGRDGAAGLPHVQMAVCQTSQRLDASRTLFERLFVHPLGVPVSSILRVMIPTPHERLVAARRFFARMVSGIPSRPIARPWPGDAGVHAGPSLSSHCHHNIVGRLDTADQRGKHLRTLVVRPRLRDHIQLRNGRDTLTKAHKHPGPKKMNPWTYVPRTLDHPIQHGSRLFPPLLRDKDHSPNRQVHFTVGRRRHGPAKMRLQLRAAGTAGKQRQSHGPLGHFARLRSQSLPGQCQSLGGKDRALLAMKGSIHLEGLGPGTKRRCTRVGHHRRPNRLRRFVMTPDFRSCLHCFLASGPIQTRSHFLQLVGSPQKIISAVLGIEGTKRHDLGLESSCFRRFLVLIESVQFIISALQTDVVILANQLDRARKDVAGRAFLRSGKQIDQLVPMPNRHKRTKTQGHAESDHENHPARPASFLWKHVIDVRRVPVVGNVLPPTPRRLTAPTVRDGPQLRRAGRSRTNGVPHLVPARLGPRLTAIRCSGHLSRFHFVVAGIERLGNHAVSRVLLL